MQYFRGNAVLFEVVVSGHKTCFSPPVLMAPSSGGTRGELPSGFASRAPGQLTYGRILMEYVLTIARITQNNTLFLVLLE